MKDGRPGRELTHSDGSDRAPTSGGLFRPQPKIPREASWVTVRVWLPRDGAGNIVTARKAISDGNVGHASLQTAEIYASWWPTEPIVSAKRVLDKVKGCLVPSLDNDKEYEGRDSDVEITFRSLDTVAINTAFHEFKTKDRDWGLLGSFFTSDYSDKLDYTNCSGLVFYLLCQGGIQKKPYFKEFKEKRFHITSAAVFGATYTAVSTRAPSLKLGSQDCI